MFNINRTLLAPAFESYKLAAAPDAVLVPLQRPIAPARLPDHRHVSFGEVRDRAGFNHLFPWRGEANKACFVDARDDGIHIMLFSLLETRATMSELITLPLPLSSSSGATSRLSEYPTIHSVSSTLFAVSDGHGRLYFVALSSDASSWSIQASFELTADDEGQELLPFRFHKLVPSPTSETTFTLLLSLVVPKDKAVAGSTATFDLLSVSVTLPSPSSEQGGARAMQLEPDWRLRSKDLPAFVECVEGEWCIGTSSLEGLYDPFAPVVSTRGTRQPERATAGLGAPVPPLASTSTAPVATPSRTTEPSPPPPFSWYQDSDSLTLAFAIPLEVPTSSIKVLFARGHLSVFVSSSSGMSQMRTLSDMRDDSDTPEEAAIKALLPKISHKPLWAPILPHSSMWTFDRESNTLDTYGILTLHLEKAHAGTKWADVFGTSMEQENGTSSALQGSDGGRQYEGVLETVDPSEMVKIAEAMEQYISELHPAGNQIPAPQLSEQQEQPVLATNSLAGQEMDLDVDSDVGRSMLVSWIKPPASEDDKPAVRNQRSLPHALLSTPIPRSGPPSTMFEIVIKYDVDGALFIPSPSELTPTGETSWAHLTTFHALAFVLASKRDTAFVYHLSAKPTRAVLAFDLPSPLSQEGKRGGGRNLFVYHELPKGEKRNGVQRVMRIQAELGHVLGAAEVEQEGVHGRRVLVLGEKAVGIFII